jgi:DNA-binding XRE family transcriptional regulator
VIAAKTKHASPVPVEQIGRSILILRGHRVLLDSELARIYGVETRVLNSSRAVEMSIYVVRAFVQLRELISSNKDLSRRLDQLEARIEKKNQGLTQVQLAEALDLTQQMVASYEVGRRRVPVSLLPQIAGTLAVSLDELIGKKDLQPAKRGPAPKLQQQIERIQQLPRSSSVS